MQTVLARKEKSPARFQAPAAARPHAAQPVAVRSILRGPRLQPKLKIGAANDRYEQEADRGADKVMRMPMPAFAMGVSGPAKAIDYDGPPGETPQKEEPAPKDQTPVKPSPAEEKTCQLPALAPSFKVTAGSIRAKELPKHLFGNTARLAAFFTPLKACKENKQWKFSLNRLDVYARVDVQPSSFTNPNGTVMTDVTSANDAAITGTNWKKVVSSLNPNRQVSGNFSCSGITYPQEIKNYPRRREFWSRKITLDHENHHLTEWTKVYRKNLIAAENKLRALTVSEAGAASEADALAKANTEAGKWFPKAYQDATATYCKTKEIDAYNRDASHYQQLVDGIRARAAKEKWN